MRHLSEKQKNLALIRVVDDDETVRQALSVFFTMADWRVKTYADGPSFLADFNPSVAGCAILDIRMPEMSGIELHNEMLLRGITLPVIFLSAHGDIEMAVEAVHRGAKTFLVKPPQNDKLLAAVESAVLDDFDGRRQILYVNELRQQWESLTPAEKRVAVLIGKGLSNATTASLLGVAERTVRGQRAAIYEKLDTENAVELSDFLHELTLAHVSINSTESPTEDKK